MSDLSHALFKLNESSIDQSSIWIDILKDDEWKRAYRPYDDEPVRNTGSSLCGESQFDEPIATIALVAGRKRR